MGITPENIIVFGSYAGGAGGEESDLDLLIIAGGFEGVDFWEFMILLGRARAGMITPMEMPGITPSESDTFNANYIIKAEVLEKGLVAG